MAAGLSVVNPAGFPNFDAVPGQTLVDAVPTAYVLNNTNYPALPASNPLTTFQGYGLQVSNVTVPAQTTPYPWLAGFFDAEMRGRVFYTDGTSIALPLIAAFYVNLYWNGAFGVSSPSYLVGSYKIVLTYASGSVDAASPAAFSVDPSVMLIMAGTAYG